MAPLITTSLREYAMQRAREYEQDGGPSDSVDDWLGLQDWTESTNTFESFDAADDCIRNALALVEARMDRLDDSDPAWKELDDIAGLLDSADSHLDDARAVITNIRRKDTKR